MTRHEFNTIGYGWRNVVVFAEMFNVSSTIEGVLVKASTLNVGWNVKAGVERFFFEPLHCVHRLVMAYIGRSS